MRNGPSRETFKVVAPNPSLKQGKRYLVGYVGVMNSQDGLDILIDVALRVKNLGRHDIHFTCVGGGPELASLRKMVQDKQLEDMMTFTGFVPDAEMLEILSTADVCVNPDRPCQMNSMSTMIKIMEYMALGKPIVQFEGTEGRFSAQEASLYSNGDDRVGILRKRSYGCWTIPRSESGWDNSGAGGSRKSWLGSTPCRTFSLPMRKLSARLEARAPYNPRGPEDRTRTNEN